MAKLAASVYGRALLELAGEEKKGLDFLEEIEEIEKVLKENPEFNSLMGHPGIPVCDKEEILKNVFQGRISEEMFGFLSLIVRKGRYGELTKIFAWYTEAFKKEQGIGTAFVTTAVELGEEKKQEVKERLLQTAGYKTIECHYQVDPGLIGGMIIRIDDRIVDSSIRTKLSDLTSQLLQIQLG